MTSQQFRLGHRQDTAGGGQLAGTLASLAAIGYGPSGLRIHVEGGIPRTQGAAKCQSPARPSFSALR